MWILSYWPHDPKHFFLVFLFLLNERKTQILSSKEKKEALLQTQYKGSIGIVSRQIHSLTCCFVYFSYFFKVNWNAHLLWYQPGQTAVTKCQKHTYRSWKVTVTFRTKVLSVCLLNLSLCFALYLSPHPPHPDTNARASVSSSHVISVKQTHFLWLSPFSPLCSHNGNLTFL